MLAVEQEKIVEQLYGLFELIPNLIAGDNSYRIFLFLDNKILEDEKVLYFLKDVSQVIGQAYGNKVIPIGILISKENLESSKSLSRGFPA